MTRREEIERAWFVSEVQSNHRYDEKTFKEAVEWADKTMIDKICEWIEDNVENSFVCVNGTMTELNGLELSRYIHKTMEE